jgi:PAS fold
MLDLSSQLVKPGRTIQEILSARVATGGFAADYVDAYRQDLLDLVAEGKPFSKITHLPDGRVVSIVNQPLAAGGWVATHEDISQAAARRGKDQASRRV